MTSTGASAGPAGGRRPTASRPGRAPRRGSPRRSAGGRQVAAALPGGHHRPAGQPLEGHVPQPRRVVPVGDPGVDATTTGGGPPRATRSRSSAHPAGFLASRSRAGTPPTSADGEAAGHLGRPTPWPRAPPAGVDAARPRPATAAMARVGLVEPARERRARPAAPAVGQRPARRAVGTPRASPRARAGRSRTAHDHARRSAEDDPALARRAADGVELPAPGRPPPSARRGAAPAPQTTSGSSALATTVRVAAPRPSAARQRPATMRTSLDPVELVARQVEQHHHRGATARRAAAAGSPRRPRARPASAGRRRPARRRDRAACWTRSSLLTTAPPAAASAAVSSRVVVVLPLVPVTRATWRPGGQVAEEVGVEAQPDPAADDRAAAPARAARDAALTPRAVTRRSARAGRAWRGGHTRHSGGSVRASSSLGGCRLGRASVGQQGADRRHDRRGVGHGVRRGRGAPACPTRTVTCGGWRTRVTSGTADERGHTCSVPHSPTGHHRGAGRRRPAGPCPSCPCSTGSKKASPRGMVPCGQDDDDLAGLAAPPRPSRSGCVRPAAPVDRDAADGPGQLARRRARRRAPAWPGSAPAGRAGPPRWPGPPRRSSCGGWRPAGPGRGRGRCSTPCDVEAGVGEGSGADERAAAGGRARARTHRGTPGGRSQCSTGQRRGRGHRA